MRSFGITSAIFTLNGGSMEPCYMAGWNHVRWLDGSMLVGSYDPSLYLSNHIKFDVDFLISCGFQL